MSRPVGQNGELIEDAIPIYPVFQEETLRRLADGDGMLADQVTLVKRFRLRQKRIAPWSDSARVGQSS